MKADYENDAASIHTTLFIFLLWLITTIGGIWIAFAAGVPWAISIGFVPWVAYLVMCVVGIAGGNILLFLLVLVLACVGVNLLKKEN